MPLFYLYSVVRTLFMNLLTIVISGIFVVLSGAFVVLLVTSIYANLKTGKHYRSSLQGQLSKLRLARMLGIQGIDNATYLHTQPIVDIHDQMQRCSGCVNTDQCDGGEVSLSKDNFELAADVGS